MPAIATIGFFDGVHTGHRCLFAELRRHAAAEGLQPLIVTFRQHPQEVLRQGMAPPLLLTPDERLAMLREQGIHQVRMLDFHDVSSWNRQRFLRYLQQQFGVTLLLLGYDHRFGADGNAPFSDYQAVAAQQGIRLLRSTPHTEAGICVSSTEIRRQLLLGDIDTANHLLGYPYTLRGTVVHGRGIGRTIGFPTANIILPDARKLVPRSGVYAVEAEIQGERWQALLNIGNNPTVGGQMQTLEAHLLRFSGNLYGKTLRLSLRHFLREERKFPSLQQLKAQINNDIQTLL